MSASAIAHRWILASAGTGKTYELSGRYLALLFRGVRPERILATTFSRKAAGEILDRVLARLVEAIEKPEKLAELNAQLAGEGLGERSRTQCLELLALVARDLHRLRIRTLDAFFVQIAGLFALELGLPPEWRILEEDEQKTLARQALGDALEDTATSEVVELLRALQHTGAGRAVERKLLGTVDDCRTAYLDAERAAWDVVRVPEGLDAGRLAEVLAELESLALPRTDKGKGPEDRNWVKARAELLRSAATGDWEAALEKGILLKLANGETAYNRHAFTPEHLALFEPLLEHAAHVLLSGVRRHNQAALGWLERFEKAFFQRKEAVRGLSFEDLPRALAPAGGAGLVEGGFDLGYRLDGRIDHLLLDEFQDTAPPQWRVLAPLAEEITADHGGEKSFFCVGDAKQSIYAWRSGEPRLLLGLGERFPALPPPTALARNWRSSPVILDTVDRVFRQIGASRAFSGNRAYEAAAARFQADYAPHVAARDLPGVAALYEAPAPAQGEEAESAVLAFAATRVATLARAAPGASIAVLLRRNNDVARVIDLLRRVGLCASGEGGNPLTDSASVLQILSALHLADHPGDSAAAFHVATSPLAEALGAGPTLDLSRPRSLAARIAGRLARKGYGEFLAELLPAVEAALAYGHFDRQRFAQLVDLGYAFDRRGELRTAAFLDFVRETKVEDPSSTQIKVMTIHASKGLEFDAVVLPELDLSMTLHVPEVLRARPDPEGELAGVSVARSHAISNLDPEGLGALHAEEDQRHVTEALCIFYVAMTRAARRLELVVRPPKNGTSTLSYATVLREALQSAPSAAAGEEPGLLWLHPDSAEGWWMPALAEPEPVPPRSRRRPVFSTPKAPRELEHKTPSAEEGARVVAVAELLAPRTSAARTRGTLIHRLLEAVEWLDDFRLNESALDALLAPLERDRAVRAEAIAAFRGALERPAIAALLTRPSGEHELWRERAFSEVLEDAERAVHWTGSFDRVVLTLAKGRTVRAQVIDFKTDRVDASGVAERAAFYAPQIEGYRRVLARMRGLELAAVHGTLAFLEPGQIHET
jgi:ATP-dependent exoDNAse (exonuclease V) beta subunit